MQKEQQQAQQPQQRTRFGIHRLDERIAPTVSAGLQGYEGQPGNQGGHGGNGMPEGLKGYEGQPGNQGG